MMMQINNLIDLIATTVGNKLVGKDALIAKVDRYLAFITEYNTIVHQTMSL